MKVLRPLLIVVCVMWTASTTAQISLTPPGAETPRAQPPKLKPKPPATKPAAAAKPAATPPSAATVTPAPAPDDPNLDLVYCAYQRGM